jgi:hypothetical protein
MKALKPLMPHAFRDFFQFDKTMDTGVKSANE